MNEHHLKFSAIALIDSKDKDRSNFGSGFIIYQDKQATYWLTCAHVITDVGGAENTLVDGSSVNLVAPSEEQLVIVRSGLDLAIVRVENFLDKKPLELCETASMGRRFVIVGYSQKDKARVITQISGCLGKSTEINLKGDRTPAWYLEIDGNTKDTLQPGYSGSPVIDQETGYVIGVVAQREGDKQGMAIAIGSLQKIAGDLPINILQAVQSGNKSDSNWQRGLELAAASTELKQLMSDLQRFFEERKAIEHKIQSIETKIEELNSKVEDNSHDPNRVELLQSLQKHRELARKYGEQVQNKFPLDLRKQLKEHPEDLNYLYVDIETCINRLYLMLRFSDISLINDIKLKLSLLDRNRYGDQGLEAYIETFKLLKKGLTYRALGESKELLLRGLISIEEQISLLN